jgi:hypothetical protein
MPDGHYVRCADCRTQHDAHDCFRIVPARGRTEGGGRPYFLCCACWDGIISAAMMTRIR